MDPRWYGQAGLQAPEFRGGRMLRFEVGLLSGPTPLGQFQGLHTRYVSLGLTYVP